MTSNPPLAQNRSTYTILPYWAWACLVISLAMSLQLRCLQYGEVIDDKDLIHSAKERGCGDNPFECFSHPVFELYYRPLTSATFSLGVRLHGVRPAWFHLENLFLDAGVDALAFWFFWLALRRERAAFLAGMIFALHPLQVCVTTFIGGRTDTLALFFLLIYAIGLLKSSRPIWSVIAILAFTAAIFSKEQTSIAVLLIPLLRPRNGEDPPRRLRPGYLIYLVPIAVYAYLAHRIMPPDAAHRAPWNAALHIEMVGRSILYFAHLFAIPTNMPIHQSTLGPWDVFQPGAMAAGYFIAGVWIALTAYVWPDRRLRLLALWAGLTLFPVINVVPIPSQFASSYRGFIPLIGIAGLVGFALDGAIERAVERKLSIMAQAAPGLVLGVIVGMSIVLTLSDVSAWENEYTLMLAETSADPNFVPAEVGLAGILRDDHHLREAVVVFNSALAKIFPDAHTEQEQIAEVNSPALERRLMSLGGLRHWPVWLGRNPLPGLGGTYQMLGQYEAAAREYRISLAYNPDDDLTREALVQCYISNGEVARATSALEELVSLSSNLRRLIWLGRLYAESNRWREASVTLKRALVQMKPDDPTRRSLEREYATAVIHAGGPYP